MTASPSRSAVNASRRRRSRRTVASASAGVSPAMNRCAMCAADRRASHARTAAPGEPGGRQRQRQPEPPGDPLARLAEILGQVPADRLGRRQHGHRVDEPEQLDLDLGIAQRQVHEPVVPPGAVPGRRAPADPLEQRPADLLGSTLEHSPASVDSINHDGRHQRVLQAGPRILAGASPHSFYGGGRPSVRIGSRFAAVASFQNMIRLPLSIHH